MTKEEWKMYRDNVRSANTLDELKDVLDSLLMSLYYEARDEQEE